MRKVQGLTATFILVGLGVYSLFFSVIQANAQIITEMGPTGIINNSQPVISAKIYSANVDWDSIEMTVDGLRVQPTVTSSSVIPEFPPPDWPPGEPWPPEDPYQWGSLVVQIDFIPENRLCTDNPVTKYINVGEHRVTLRAKVNYLWEEAEWTFTVSPRIWRETWESSPLGPINWVLSYHPCCYDLLWPNFTSDNRWWSSGMISGPNYYYNPPDITIVNDNFSKACFIPYKEVPFMNDNGIDHVFGVNLPIPSEGKHLHMRFKIKGNSCSVQLAIRCPREGSLYQTIPLTYNFRPLPSGDYPFYHTEYYLGYLYPNHYRIIDRDIARDFLEIWQGAFNPEHVTALSILVREGEACQIDDIQFYTTPFDSCYPSNLDLNANLKPYGVGYFRFSSKDTPLGRYDDLTIYADSGERLETWWVIETVNGHERYRTQFRYIGPRTPPEGLTVAKCFYKDGANKPWVLGPDDNGNDKPDYFHSIHLENWDFGEDDNGDGLLNVDRYDYDVLYDKLTITKNWFEYRCPPSTTFPKGCFPPYGRRMREPLIIDPRLGPETEALFELPILQPHESGSPTTEIIMSLSGTPLCDLDWDGDCDGGDLEIIGNAVGKCLGEIDYNPLVDIDGDGCVTKFDQELLLQAASNVSSDNIPPTTIASISPSPNTAGWNNTDVIATLNANDNAGGTGVKEICYTLSGVSSGGGTISGSTTQFSITTEGTTMLTYWAIDNAGNTETQKSLEIRVDKTPPVINVSATPNNLWPPNHKMVKVNISGAASDQLSGVVTTSFKVTDEYGKVQPAISNFGNIIQLEAWRNGDDLDGRLYTISVTAVDKAGNQANASTTVICPHNQGNKKP